MAEQLSSFSLDPFRILDLIDTADISDGNRKTKGGPSAIAQTVASFLQWEEYFPLIQSSLVERKMQAFKSKPAQLAAAAHALKSPGGLPLGFHKITKKESGNYFCAEVLDEDSKEMVSVSSLSVEKQVELFRQAKKQTEEHLCDYITGRREDPPHSHDLGHLVHLDLINSDSAHQGNQEKLLEQLEYCHRFQSLKMYHWEFRGELDFSSLSIKSFGLYSLKTCTRVKFPSLVEKIELVSCRYLTESGSWLCQYPCLIELKLEKAALLKVVANELPTSLKSLHVDGASFSSEQYNLARTSLERIYLVGLRGTQHQLVFPRLAKVVCIEKSFLGKDPNISLVLDRKGFDFSMIDTRVWRSNR